MGYRWFNANGVAPVFPFGYGLSYSSFQFSGLKLSQTGRHSTPTCAVSFTVKNTGSVAGSDVGQVYLTKPNTLAASPPNQLVGFKKVTFAPGTSTQGLGHRARERARLLGRGRPGVDRAGRRPTSSPSATPRPRCRYRRTTTSPRRPARCGWR